MRIKRNNHVDFVTCVRASVSFQVERVVESFAAKRAQVTFDVRVTFHVSVEQPLQSETLGTKSAREFGRIVGIGSVDRSRRTGGRIGSASSFTRFVFVLRSRRAIRFGSVAIARRVLSFHVVNQRIFNAVTAVDEFDRCVARQSQLHRNILKVNKTIQSIDCHFFSNRKSID